MSQNVSRWRNPESFSPQWKSRTELLCELIPKESSVIEFGVGLAPISSCKNFKSLSRYTPTDFIRRKGTAVYDLNADPLLEFEKHDIAVFSGVLEYIKDLPKKISFVSARVNTIITSYCTLDNYPENREMRDWVNSYTDEEFIELFLSVGYEILYKTNWKKQTIYVFGSKNS